MDEIFSIYCITNLLDQKKYIGVTKQEPASKRWAQHKSPKGPHQQEKPLHRAIIKHGEDNFKFEVICQTKDVKVAVQLEIDFIEKYKTLLNEGWGYNLTKGGDGTWGYKFSDIQRKHLSEAAKKRSTPEYRKRVSEQQKGKKKSIESNLKRSNTLKGRAVRGSGWSMPEEHKQAISKSMMDHKKSDEFKEKTRKRMSKSWLLTSPEGKQHTITNLRAFCREHNLSAENLWKVSKGIISQSQGWHCRSIVK